MWIFSPTSLPADNALLYECDPGVMVVLSGIHLPDSSGLSSRVGGLLDEQRNEPNVLLGTDTVFTLPEVH